MPSLLLSLSSNTLASYVVMGQKIATFLKAPQLYFKVAGILIEPLMEAGESSN